MTVNDLQGELALSRHVSGVSVPVEIIHGKKSAGAAFSLACDASGLDDKEIFIPLGIDPATFSRIKSGKNSLCWNSVSDFCRIVGNTIYPEWLAYQVGCGLVMLKSEAERRAEAAEVRAAEAEKKLQWAMDVLKGVRA
jgi:hypothetical protein